MARIRTVKPEFFRHELLQELEANHLGKYPMFVFEGLWGHCDSNGVFPWRPKQLKLDILPFLPFDMTETLGILLESKQIYKGLTDKGVFGFVPTFRLHQRLTGKEVKDGVKYPFLPEWEAIVKQQGSNGEIPDVQEGKGKGKGKEGSNEPDSNVKVFIDYAFQTFKDRFKEKLLIDGQKDGAIVKKLLGTYDLERLKGLWDVFMQSDDDWLNKAGRSIGIFRSQINKLLITPGKRPNNPGQENILDKIRRAEKEREKEDAASSE